MIFHAHKSIFFHIGKAAGSSVEHTFMPGKRDPYHADYTLFYGFDKTLNLFLQHATPSFMRDQIDPAIFDHYFKFTIVRNPFSRLVSVYHYQRLGKNDQTQKKFERFIHDLPDLLQKKKSVRGSHTLEQVEYTHTNNQLICDAVLYFEDLPRCFKSVKQKTGLKKDLSWHNKSKSLDWSSKSPHQFYTSEMIDVIHSIYARDFAVLGYSLDPENQSPPSLIKRLTQGLPKRSIHP